MGGPMTTESSSVKRYESYETIGGMFRDVTQASAIS